MVGLKPCVTIHIFSPECIGSLIMSFQGHKFIDGASGAWFGANLANFIPFSLTTSVIVRKLFCITGAVANGNVDMGIYDVNGTKLTSAVNAPQGAINTIQEFDIDDTPIGPGTFYFAVSLDNAVGTIFMYTFGAGTLKGLAGIAEMAAAYPLPAVATLATITAGWTVPKIGLTTRTVF